MSSGGPFERLAVNCLVINATTIETIKLTSGYLLKEIFDHGTKKLSSALQPDVSLWMYFAHDFTLTYLLNSLKVFTVRRFSTISSNFETKMFIFINFPPTATPCTVCIVSLPGIVPECQWSIYSGVLQKLNTTGYWTALHTRLWNQMFIEQFLPTLRSNFTNTELRWRMCEE